MEVKVKTQHYILGTAGHIDHGKTTLIKALTGIDTDRLPEEKKRGLSIDLGFAHFTLPSGRIAGIVDVPGHNKFLKNMLAGVGGFDLGMLVVDAREGPKAQTKEHLDVLELVGLSGLIVVITKIDLLEPDELQSAISDIKNFIQKSTFKEAPVVAVASTTGKGFPELISALDKELDKIPPRNPSSPPRLPIDRVFHVPGFGTVITGTLLSGTIHKNDEMMVLPIGKKVRIRHIEVYGEEQEMTVAGSRVAANLAGIEYEMLNRGMVMLPLFSKELTNTATSIMATNIFEGKVAILPEAPLKVKDGGQIRLYLGTAEYLGRIFLLDKKELGQGEEGFAQFRLNSNGVAFEGDRFVLRSFSPLYTLGGGVILKTHASKSRKKEKVEELKIKEIICGYKEKGKDLKSRLLNLFQNSPGNPFTLKGLKEQLKLEQIEIHKTEIEDTLTTLIKEGTICPAHSSTYILSRSVQASAKQLIRTLNNLSKKHRFKEGFTRNEVIALTKLNLIIANFAIDALLVQKSIKENNGLIALFNHTGELPLNLAKLKDKIFSLLNDNKFAPPTLHSIGDELKIPQGILKEIKTYLVEREFIVFINDEIAYPKDILETAKEKLKEFLIKEGSITPAQVRELLGISRKYVIPLLEYLDRIKITIRKEDKRILTK